MAQHKQSRESRTSRSGKSSKAPAAQSGQNRTVIGTLVKAGRLKDAILMGEEEVQAGGASPDVRAALCDAYWQLGMIAHTARAIDSLLPVLCTPELLALRIKVATAQGAAPAQAWISSLKALAPDHAYVNELPVRTETPEEEGCSTPLELAQWFLRRRERAKAERPIKQLEQEGETRALGAALRWGWERDVALTPSSRPSGRVSSRELAVTTHSTGRGGVAVSEAELAPDGPSEEDAVTSVVPFTTFDPTSAHVDLEIEAGSEEDDLPTQELVVVSRAGGAASVGIPALRRRFPDDPEVVVIEREGGSARIGAGELWFRGAADQSWRAAAIAGLTRASHSPVTASLQTSENEDRATDIVQLRDGVMHRKARLPIQVDDEDDLVEASQQTGSNRYTPYIPVSPRVALPVEPPPDAQRPLSSAALAGALTGKAKVGTAEHSLQPSSPQPSSPPRSGRLGPVAQLAREPAVPLTVSVVPPLTPPPVPSLPSQLSGEPQPVLPTDLSSGFDPLRTSAEVVYHKNVLLPGAAAAAASTPAPAFEVPKRQPETPTVIRGAKKPIYFQRSSRYQGSNRRTYWLGAALIAVVLGAGWGYLLLHELAEQKALRTEVEAALLKGAHPGMSVALGALEQVENPSSALEELELALAWTLWAEEGIKLGEAPPSGVSLKSAGPESSFFQVVARAQLDRFQGEVLGGAARVRTAIALHPTEPMLQLLLGQLSLSAFELTAKATDREEARAAFSRALELVSQGIVGQWPVSKAAVYVALAELERKTGGTRGLEFLDLALQADPGSSWAGLRRALATLPGSTDAAGGADAAEKGQTDALDAVAVRLKDGLSPRQLATLTLARADAAFRAGQVGPGMQRLEEAARQDMSWSVPQVWLATAELDRGRIRSGIERLEKLLAVAPMALDALVPYVDGLIEDTRTGAAGDMLRKLPDTYQELPSVRLLKARLSREISDLNGAEAQLAAGLELSPQHLGLLLEQAFLKDARREAAARGGGLDQGFGQAAEDALSAVRERAEGEGRPYLVPWLDARLMVLRGADAQMLSGAAARSKESARALAVLAQAALAAGDPASALAWLEEARQVGDLPGVVLVLAKLKGADSDSREKAREDLRQLIQERCGDGPVCQEANRLLEMLR